MLTPLVVASSALALVLLVAAVVEMIYRAVRDRFVRRSTEEPENPGNGPDYVLGVLGEPEPLPARTMIPGESPWP